MKNILHIHVLIVYKVLIRPGGGNIRLVPQHMLQLCHRILLKRGGEWELRRRLLLLLPKLQLDKA